MGLVSTCSLRRTSLAAGRGCVEKVLRDAVDCYVRARLVLPVSAEARRLGTLFLGILLPAQLNVGVGEKRMWLR
jgi:hypothetical protein